MTKGKKDLTLFQYYIIKPQLKTCYMANVNIVMKTQLKLFEIKTDPGYLFF